MWTLSSLQMHPHPMIVVDEDATSELQVKTVKVRTIDFRGARSADTLKYFKSIERVGAELGFQQQLPRKRDSLIDGAFIALPQHSAMKLTVPQMDISRSAGPVLEPMSARLSDEEAKPLVSMDALEDSPTSRMSARVY
jgi:glucosamine-6-phosphate deaminase